MGPVPAEKVTSISLIGRLGSSDDAGDPLCIDVVVRQLLGVRLVPRLWQQEAEPVAHVCGRLSLRERERERGRSGTKCIGYIPCTCDIMRLKLHCGSYGMPTVTLYQLDDCYGIYSQQHFNMSDLLRGEMSIWETARHNLWQGWECNVLRQLRGNRQLSNFFGLRIMK